MCCINTHLTFNQLTLRKYCIHNLLYMNVTQYQNKTLYNKVFFSTDFKNLLKISPRHRTNQCLITQIRWFSMIFNTMPFIILWFSSLSDIAFYTLNPHHKILSFLCHNISLSISILTALKILYFHQIWLKYSLQQGSVNETSQGHTWMLRTLMGFKVIWPIQQYFL